MNIALQDPSPKQRKAYDLSNFRVLLVEDYDFIRDLLSTSLREIGIGTVFRAENGLIGKERILNYNATVGNMNIDVVLLDWLMPEMSGLKLLQWIRNHKSDSIRFLPVIVCSAYTSHAVVEESRDNGATEVLVKPISAEKVAHRIQNVIERPRPFIKTESFFGPDRRRKEEDYSGPEKRIIKAEEIQRHVESSE